MREEEREACLGTDGYTSSEVNYCKQSHLRAAGVSKERTYWEAWAEGDLRYVPVATYHPIWYLSEDHGGDSIGHRKWSWLDFTASTWS